MTAISDKAACVREPLSDSGRDLSFSLRARFGSTEKEADGLRATGLT